MQACQCSVERYGIRRVLSCCWQNLAGIGNYQLIRGRGYSGYAVVHDQTVESSPKSKVLTGWYLPAWKFVSSQVKHFTLNSLWLTKLDRACVCSIVKLSFLWNPNNPYLSDVSPTMIWSSIQLGTSILCACLPTLTPLLRLVREKLGMSTTRSSTTEKAKKMTPNQSSMNYSNADPSSYHRMQEDDSVYRANVSSDSRELEQLDSTSHNSIQVNKTVEIV